MNCVKAKYLLIYSMDKKRNNQESGFCLIEMLVAIFLGSMLLVSILLLVTQSLSHINYINHSLEILHMNRFARQVIIKDIRFAKDVPKIRYSSKQLYSNNPSFWGYSIAAGNVYKLLSNGTPQPLTGSLYREKGVQYHFVRINDVGFMKDENQFISFTWQGNVFGNNVEKVNIGVYPYCLYVK